MSNSNAPKTGQFEFTADEEKAVRQSGRQPAGAPSLGAYMVGSIIGANAPSLAASTADRIVGGGTDERRDSDDTADEQ